GATFSGAGITTGAAAAGLLSFNGILAESTAPSGYDGWFDMNGNGTLDAEDILVITTEIEDDFLIFNIYLAKYTLYDLDIIAVSLQSRLDNTKTGHAATVSAEGDIPNSEEIVYCTVADPSIGLSVDKVKITPDGTASFSKKEFCIDADNSTGFVTSDVIRFSLNNGFEFTSYPADAINITATSFSLTGYSGRSFELDGSEISIKATTAAVGEEAILTVSCSGYLKASETIAVVISPSGSGEAKFKVVNVLNVTAEEALLLKNGISGPELQLKITDMNAPINQSDTFDIILEFENIEALDDFATVYNSPLIKVYRDGAVIGTGDLIGGDEGDDAVKLIIREDGYDLEDDDIILFTFDENFGLTKTTAGTEATVTVSGDFGESDELVLVSVMEKALSIICKKPFDVPQEEMVSLYRVTVEPTVGTFSATDVLTFRLSKGFEFVQVPTGAVWEDEDTFTISGITGDSLIFETGTIVIEATTAEIGDVAILSVFCDGYNSAAVEVAEVIKPTVLMSVDEDEDIPEFYSGTSTNNIGLTDDSDHISLAVNLRETWVGEWVSHKPFTLTLPEGVYVTDVSVEGNMAGGANGTMTQAELEDWFRTAYTNGEYKNFTFAKDTWEDTVTGDSRNDIDFTLKLVATPSFVGDVTLTLESTAFDTQEVVIARFIAPYTVETAETTSSELNKTVPVADIVVEEAAPGLWEEGSTFLFDFDNTLPTFVNSGYMLSSNNQTSQIEVSAPTDAVGFTVHEESVKRAAVVTLSDLKATTPAEGDKYGLYLNTSATEAFLQTRLYSASGTVVGDVLTNGSAHLVEKNYLAVTPGAAEEVLPFRFEVSKESGLAGKTVELKIDMAGNPGIIAACMEISYDADKLTLLEVTDTGLLNDYTSSPTLDTNPYKLRWEDALAENNMQTGTIAVLKFQIKENCEPGIVPVYLELSEDEIFNTALELVP
ncbi:MAG: hypothetical protein IKT73_09770, partial [Anaerotignum sp.]|nr:hypothetical protein [Anaerotignum sp.]